MAPKREPLITVAGALAGKSPTKRSQVEVLEADSETVTLRLRFVEPALSKSGKAYVCGFGSASEGDLRFNVLAYIPIPKGDRRPAKSGDVPEPEDVRAVRAIYGRRER